MTRTTRLLKLSLIPILLTGVLLPAAAQPDEPSTELRNPKSGVSVVLPSDWEFQASEKRLIALSKDRKATVRLASLQIPFDTAVSRPKETVGQSGVDVTSVDGTAVKPGDERGGLEGLASVHGRAINDKGQSVDYLAYILRLGNTVDVAVGAWINDSDEETVRGILNSLKVELSLEAGGLALRDDRTGASIQLPESWRAFATPFGLTALEPYHKGMVMILYSEDDFAALRRNTRAFLKKRVFKDVSIEDSAELQASDRAYPKGFAEVVMEQGTATDRFDGRTANFEILVARQPKDKRGVLILGAWKDPDHRQQVQDALASLRADNRSDEE